MSAIQQALAAFGSSGATSAFPVLQSTSTGGSNSATTTYAITMPSGVTVGDLLVVFFAGGDSTLASVAVSTGTGWRRAIYGGGPNDQLSIYMKIADGSDSLTLTVNSMAAEWIAYRFSNASDHMDGAVSTTQYDPPAHTPWGGAKNYKWLVCAAIDDAREITAAPSGYGNILNGSTTSATVGASSFDRDLNASSENPGVYTTSAAANTLQATVAIYPAEVYTDPNFANVQLLLSGDGTNGGTTYTDHSSHGRTPSTTVGTPTTVRSDPSFNGSALSTAINNGLMYVVAGGYLSSASNDFTVEGWVQVTSNTNAGGAYVDGRYEMLVLRNGGVKQLTYGSYTTAGTYYSKPTVTAHAQDITSVRAHVAFVRISGVISFYFNGTLVRTDATPDAFTGQFDEVIIGGARALGGTRANGGLWDEFRVTANVGIYTGNFTPRPGPFPRS